MQHIDVFCHFFPQGIFKKLQRHRAAPGTSASASRACAPSTIWMRGFASWTALRIIRKCYRSACRRSKAWSGRTRRRNSPASPMTGSPSFAPNIPSGLWLRRRPADERARRGRQGSRAHPHSRQCQRLAASHQRQRAVSRRPQYFPIFEIAAKANKPICLHPARTAAFPDFAAEKSRATRSGPSSAGPTRPAPPWHG